MALEHVPAVDNVAETTGQSVAQLRTDRAARMARDHDGE